MIEACFNVNAQQDSTYSIIVAGHAYGAHSGSNLGLHPPLLEKLNQNVDSTIAYIFLTGDIVNHSTTESWQQVEEELSALGLNSCYIMGNHDDNSIGHQIFEDKHGGLFYSFTFRNELYIVLNSTESDRSISAMQLGFLDDVLKNTDKNKVFVFFHEIIWNSSEKYKLVRSNSRSRYDQMKDHSNFWDEVYPMLANYPEKEFYLIAGDVGGNPDAIAASYDKWENVTLISSGMGEVADENYLKVDILPDSVLFTLIPLNDDVEMHAIQWYNVPEAPQEIEGPNKVNVPQYGVPYQVSPVFNTTSYRWNLVAGTRGQSITSSINIDFSSSFTTGEISVQAVNDGFGESEPTVMEISANSETAIDNKNRPNKFRILQSAESIQIVVNSEKGENALLRIYGSTGNLIFSSKFYLNQGINTKTISKSGLKERIVICELSVGSEKFIQKGILLN